MSNFINFPESHAIIQGLDEVKLPDMVTIRQSYDETKIDDIQGTVVRELEEKIPNKDWYKDKNICITVGSRGIPDLDVIVRTMCDILKSWGAKPFLIPAMGSHGGATAEGQLEMLAGYNITEESMGVPIRSSMEVEQYDELDWREFKVPLYCDKYAMHADGIVIFNKVKPHTDFRGAHESGLCKMIAIGIAKHKGAAAFHSFGFEHFAELIPQVSEKFIAKCPVVFGLGVVQNAYDDICTIEACTAKDLMETDARLLEIAKKRMAKFLFDDVNLLIIDEMGKNISGNGHDPNVTGRNLMHSFGSVLKLDKLFIRSITPEAHHIGSGLAACDITTRAVLNDVDWDATWTNVATTGMLTGASIPMYANTDEEAVKICLRTLHCVPFEKLRVVHILNTLALNEIEVSQQLYETIKDMPGISYVSGPTPMKFNMDGSMNRLKLSV